MVILSPKDVRFELGDPDFSSLALFKKLETTANMFA
jgi:hypothetical protein